MRNSLAGRHLACHARRASRVSLDRPRAATHLRRTAWVSQWVSSALPGANYPDGTAGARGRPPAIGQCAARINPMNTDVKSVKMKACRNATNNSSTITPVASSDAAIPTR